MPSSASALPDSLPIDMDEALALLHHLPIPLWAGQEMQVARGIAGLVALQALAVVMMFGQAWAQVAPGSPPTQSRPSPTTAPLNEQEAAWAQAVREHVTKHRRYPRAASDLGQQGTVVMLVTVGRDGTVISTEMQRSSGFASLDEEARNMVWRSHPLPPPPPAIAIGDRYLVLEIPIVFRRDRKTR